ncbi:MAG: hypothetical protein CVV56_08450 [Tenericutes bacterium HGW-Tenericutes-1]|nr:MAG: hypothetical protein CVV58_00055 [Tenericutes bacterium HGW-Tenericutes-3]PKK99972.1 MAG: hypothetical protein CVV56_08450 [Tenericutes bacterium HGW-Tenericutes-1]
MPLERFDKKRIMKIVDIMTSLGFPPKGKRLNEMMMKGGFIMEKKQEFKKPEVKPAAKPEVKPAAKPEVKPAQKPIKK